MPQQILVTGAHISIFSPEPGVRALHVADTDGTIFLIPMDSGTAEKVGRDLMGLGLVIPNGPPPS